MSGAGGRSAWVRALAGAAALAALCAAAGPSVVAPSLALASDDGAAQPFTEHAELFPLGSRSLDIEVPPAVRSESEEFGHLRTVASGDEDETGLPDVLDDAQPPARPLSAPQGLSRATASGSTDIPPIVLLAYRRASERAGELVPGCVVPWTVLAGIGKVETGHARHGGATATPDGQVSPRILGPQLNGAGATAAIRDSDGGRWDGDTAWDRAVGPMQFIPSSWRVYGRDGNGDGQADPNNVFDATAGAVVHLCRSAPGDLRNPELLRRALYGYNRSLEYVATVSAWIARYEGYDPGPGSLEFGPPSSSPSPGLSSSGVPSSFLRPGRYQVVAEDLERDVTSGAAVVEVKAGRTAEAGELRF